MVKELKTNILISESPWEELNSFDEIKSIVTIFEAIGIIEKKEDNSQKYNLRNAINKISFQNKKIVLINSELSQKQVEEYEDDMNYYHLIKMLLNDKYDLVELESKLIEKYEKDIEKIDIEHVRDKNILKTKIDDCIKEHKYLYIEKK